MNRHPKGSGQVAPGQAAGPLRPVLERARGVPQIRSFGEQGWPCAGEPDGAAFLEATRQQEQKL